MSTETRQEMLWWLTEVGTQATKIDWKDDSKNLTKTHPRVIDEEDGDMPMEGGSFFNFFEVAQDPFDVSYIRCALCRSYSYTDTRRGWHRLG